MAYADYSFYLEEFLGADEAVVPEQDWKRYSAKAANIIDEKTLGRVAKLPSIPDAVRMCACELTEMLYCMGQMTAQAYKEGTPGPLSSYSNDGQSGTFNTDASLWTESAIKKRTADTIRCWLLPLGLLYSGVPTYE